MSKPFPIYKKFDDAICFRCGAGPFRVIERSDFPLNRGEFTAICGECHAQTWFDLAPLEKCKYCGTNGDHYCPADVATD